MFLLIDIRSSLLVGIGWSVCTPEKSQKILSPFFLVCISIYNHVWRLNGVISLVTVFEELFDVTSSFWLRDKVNQEICLFHERNFELNRRGDSFLQVSTWGCNPLFSRHEKSKRFLPFCRMDFSICSLNARHSCIAKGGNSVPTRIGYN